jgi:hypothetical protein
VAVVVIVTVVAAVAALLPVNFFSTAPTKTSWTKHAAEVLVTRITFSNSPYIPLAPPRLRTV